MAVKLTEEIIKARLDLLGLGHELLSPYTRLMDKHLIRFAGCGHEANVRLNDLLNRGVGCGECNGPRSMNHDKASTRLADLGHELLSPFTRMKDQHLVRFGGCGHEHWAELANIFTRAKKYPGEKNRVCGKCVGPQSMNHEKAAARVADKCHELISPYTGSLDLHLIRYNGCNHEVWAYLYDVERDYGCGKCSGTWMKTQEEIAAELAELGLEILSTYKDMNTKALIKFGCCGLEKWIEPSGPLHRNAGCGECLPSGFKYEQPAYLYLLESEKYNALQIGITGVNTTRCRLSRHAARGWPLVKKWTFDVGRDAYNVEQLVKNYWRERGFPQAVSSDETGWAGGFSETVCASLVSVEEVIAQVEAELN